MYNIFFINNETLYESRISVLYALQFDDVNPELDLKVGIKL